MAACCQSQFVLHQKSEGNIHHGEKERGGQAPDLELLVGKGHTHSQHKIRRDIGNLSSVAGFIADERKDHRESEPDGGTGTANLKNGIG